jgi:dihydroneopterin aldolase
MSDFPHPDKIILTGLTFYGYHGTRVQEKELGQRFLVNLELEADLRQAAQTDDLHDTINYAAVWRAIRPIMEGDSRNLMERLAQDIVDALIIQFPVQAVRIRIVKPSPPIQGAITGTSAIEFYRTRTN